MARLKLPDGVDLERLCSSISNSRRALEPFRRERRLAVKQYVGKHYSDDGPREDVPVNMIAEYVTIMSRSLVAKNPSVMFSTFDTRQKAVVSAMEAWAKDEIEEMELAFELRDWVTDALFSLGIMKVGLATPVDSALARWDLPSGQPFAKTISLDDWVWDMFAKTPKELTYCGHRYRVPVDVANEFLRKGREDKFEATDPMDNNSDGDERLWKLGRGAGNSTEEFEEHVDLWEIELPRHKLVVTLRDDGGIPSPERPVRIAPLVAPPCGHYHYLGMYKVPDNLMPKAPVHDLIDTHLAINRSYRKLIAQVDRFKSVLPVRGGQMSEAGGVKQASDGEIIECENASELKEVSFGGPSALVFQMAEHLKTLFEGLAGNLALLGGRSPQSKTAAQDKMLNENASAGVSDMQDTTITGTAKVMKSLAWYWWNHPEKEMLSQYSARSTPEFKMTRRVRPQQRRGPMPRVKVDPYSMMHSTPQSRLAFMNGVVAQMQPMMGLLQQQGVFFDVNTYLERVGRYGDEPDLQDIFQYQDPPEQEAASASADSGDTGPANKTTTIERRSMGGADSQGSQRQEITNQVRQMAAAQGGE